MEMKGTKLRGLMLLLAASTLAVAVSCGGGGGDGGGGTPLTEAEKAAATTEAAKGAIELSMNVGQAASYAAGAVPPEAYTAPGRKSGAPSLENVGKIDPRLQSIVEKMVAKMQSRTMQGALGKAKTLSAPRSAVSTTTVVDCDSGTYTVNSSLTTGATTTTANFSVTYANCMDLTFHEKINGTMSGTYTIDSADNSQNAVVTANMTFTDYETDNTTVQGTFVMDGAFTANNVNNASGLNTAKGAFTWTMPTTNGNLVMAFTFGSGSTPISDTWTRTTDGSGTTETHTGSGAYGLSLSSPGGSVGFTITLTNLVSSVFTAAGTGNEDLTIDGSISISWNPDMSQWGCLNGTYVFTTVTPIHTPFFNYCPTSGELQVNNATIEFGQPAGEQVTVTINGVSKVFTDCDSLGGGICS